MSAIPDEFVQKTAKLSEEVTRPFPNSRKVYVEGSRPDIRVGMREVHQDDTAASFGAEVNPPIPVYDTSGPFTDPDVEIDLMKGMPDLRTPWIEERGDTELLDGPTSDYGQERMENAELAKLQRAIKIRLHGVTYGLLRNLKRSIIIIELDAGIVDQNVQSAM